MIRCQWFRSQVVKAAGCSPAILCLNQSGTSICRTMSDGSDTGLENRGQRKLWGSTPPSGATSKGACSIPFPRFPKEPRKLHIRARLFPFPFKAKCFEGSGVEYRANPVFLSQSKQNALMGLEAYDLNMRS